MSKQITPFDVASKPPAFLQNEAPTGNENVTSDSLATPQLKVLQPQSREIMELKGVQAGQMLVTVSNKAYDKLWCVNVGFDSHWVIWRKRELGGGKSGEAKTQAEAVDMVKNLPGNQQDYDISQSHVHHLILLDQKGAVMSPANLYLSSTGLRFSQRWNTEIMLAYEGMPRFSGVWELTTRTEKNTKGTWFAFNIEFAGFVSEALYNVAKDIHANTLSAPKEWTPPATADATAS